MTSEVFFFHRKFSKVKLILSVSEDLIILTASRIYLNMKTKRHQEEVPVSDFMIMSQVGF
jgi:hypothetical protein